MNQASGIVNNNYFSLVFSEMTNDILIWIDPYYFISWSFLLFTGGLIGMSPLGISQTHIEDTPTFSTHIGIFTRRTILLVALCLFCLPLVLSYMWSMVYANDEGTHLKLFLGWFFAACMNNAWLMIAAFIFGNGLRLFRKRYISVVFSKLFKHFWFTQHEDKLSNIVEEVDRYKSKNYNPELYYDLKNQVFIGLDDQDNPLYVSRSTWSEVNMQVIGPTRYGKGVLAGTLCDQSIRVGDCIFYIAPKIEKFLPHIMYNAAIAAGRKFYYLDLNDTGPGSWGPFLGGKERDALARLFSVIGLELSGDAGTDYYKVIEREELAKAFQNGRSLSALLTNIDAEKASRAISVLKHWSQYQTYSCKSGKGFSIERAMKENAVVYVQGSLSDSVVKSATKCFINETVQEAARLAGERQHHLTMIVDEVRFLVSKQLADALATIVGFDVNIVTMYQSILDLMSPDDSSLNGKSLMQSINSNSQLKAIYGGADSETADWVSDLSGETLVNVPKMEKSKINEAGAEIWKNDRTISTETQALIHSNIVKILPPRVCVLFRPMSTAKIAFTSFVEVKSTEPLDALLLDMTVRAESIKQQKSQSMKLKKQPLNSKANETKNEIHGVSTIHEMKEAEITINNHEA